MNHRNAKMLMARAFSLSLQCSKSDSAFAVGALACTEDLTILAESYSRETGIHDHAEEILITKLEKQNISAHTMICTLEPCLHRQSKSVGCAQRIVAHGFSRVFYAIKEDDTFLQQKGIGYLESKGIEVIKCKK